MTRTASFVAGIILALLVVLFLWGAIARPRTQRLRDGIKALKTEARHLRGQARMADERARMDMDRADSLAAVVLQLQAKVTKEQDRYHEDVGRYRGAGPDSVRRVILWANPR